MTRVLAVRLSAMGDVVQSLGAIEALHRARPDVEIVALTQRPFAPLFDGVPGVARLVVHDRDGGLGAVWRTRRELRRARCDVALDLQGNAKSALFCRLAGARERIGAGSAWRQEPWSRVLLTRTVAVDGPRHPAAVALAVVRAIAPTAEALSPRLRATDAEVERAAARLRAIGVDVRRPFRVVVVGRPADPRSQREAALAQELADQPAMPSVALLGPAEAGVAVPAGARALRQARGELRELVGLGALLASVGSEVVGPDQGAIHVLAAAGARATVLFGPQDPARTAPPGARALQHPSPPPCMPCRARRCRHRDGPVCMAFTSAAGRPVQVPQAARWPAPPVR